MPKKEWTEEERKAFSEKMKRVRQEKLDAQRLETILDAEAAGDLNPEPTDPGTPKNAELSDIERRLAEMEQNQNYWREIAMEMIRNGAPAQPAASGPQAGNQGLVGTYEKYTVDPKHYPDPRERLALEPRLQRFAFPMNYELGWEVTVSSYKTIDGVNTREPKFTIELYRIVMDEDTGEATNGRYTICRGIFHEDPETALVIARENGVSVEDYEERAFLDEMRYLRIRDWLLEAFYPPKPAQAKQNKKDVVVGGKLVEFFEINSETSESVPFNQLKTKL